MSKIEKGVYNQYLDISISEKILNNEIANSCYVNLIVKKYKKQLNGKNKKYKFVLNHYTLCELCEIDYKNDNIGLSINKSINFFQKFNIGLCVYGPFGLIYKYKPSTPNKNINSRSLYIYIQNNHCYEINKDIKKFEQNIWKK